MTVDQYVYNSTYAFAENRVAVGIDLEGKELYQTTDYTKGQKVWNVKLNVANNDLSNSPKEVENRATQTKNVIEKVFSGTDSKAFETKVNVDCSTSINGGFKRGLQRKFNL